MHTQPSLTNDSVAFSFSFSGYFFLCISANYQLLERDVLRVVVVVISLIIAYKLTCREENDDQDHICSWQRGTTVLAAVTVVQVGTIPVGNQTTPRQSVESLLRRSRPLRAVVAATVKV